MLNMPRTERKLSLLGSTNVPLNASGDFESDIFTVSSSERITGSCYADQDGTLYVYQGMDGINFDFEQSYSYTSTEKLGFSVDVVCLYAYIIFVNGLTGQTEFRLSWGTV